MSGNPHHALRSRGRALARELEGFVTREIPDREEQAQVLVGALEYLEGRTAAVRNPRHPWPAPPEDLPHGDPSAQ